MQSFYRLFANTRTIAAIIFTIFLPLGVLAQDHVEGVIRIKISEDLAAQLEESSISTTTNGEVVTGVQSLDAINKQFSVNRLTRVFPHAGKHEGRHRKHGLHLWYEVRMNKNVSVTSALRSYQSDKKILRAEAVLEKAIIGFGKSNFGPLILNENTSISAALPDGSNDPMLASQWHYNNTGQTGGSSGADIRLLDAWKNETGRPDVIIAVNDGGIQTDHPDLAANMWINKDEVAGNNVDDDNNGYVDDVHGYSFVNGTGVITAHEHGTHVAGTLAAVNNNGAGVAGVAGGSGTGDGARLMSCALFSDENAPDGFAQAYVYSADNGAVISQNSWGYTVPGAFEQVVLDAIDYFIAEAGKDEFGQQTGPMNGGIVIFSAGNFDDEGNYYPAFYEPVLAVAATNHKDVRAYYSNYGPWVDISAPGGETINSETEGVVSTLPGGQYGAFMGTSMACPHVSGVAALIISKYGKQGFEPPALRARLVQSVDNIDNLNPSYSGKLGSGRLNAALALHTGDGVAPEPVKDLSVLTTDVGEITLTWTSPKDAGGFVTEYDLRYSTSPITAQNFGNATQVEDLPWPAAAGTKETFTVKNLPGGTVFYFAIRSSDFDGNMSALSNVVSQRSALTPALVITPSEITENLRTAETSTRTFSIQNKGEGPLKFSIEPVAENLFVALNPLEGEVNPSKEQIITVTFDASGKLSGTYYQEVSLRSNDPQNGTAILKFTLKVTNNGAPIASVEPETLDFKSVQKGMVAHRSVKVHNAGSEPLVIRNIKSDNRAFSSDLPTPFTVPSFQTADVRITFGPLTTGIINANVSLSTNDPKHNPLTVPVKGEGLQQAPLVVSPNSFEETLQKGTTVTRTMVLRNNGSQDRRYRLESMNNRLRTADATTSETRSGVARQKNLQDDSLDVARIEKLEKHQGQFTIKNGNKKTVATPLGSAKLAKEKMSASARTNSDKSLAYKRELRKYVTGFETFSTGAVGEQEGWFALQGWTIEDKNPATGLKHFRGTSRVSGSGETYAISPYLFEYEEFYYPQYTSVNMRINLDGARGTTWEVIPQDPWSYVATRVRFNADGTVEALVIDNEYASHWKKVPVAIPSGYFNLAIEYNNAGSDTSGFPTYYLFINNQHVFSGTGLASGIGQLAFVSPMETSGPVFEVDDVQLVGGEYIPQFVQPDPMEGVVRAGESATINVTFDASVMKAGTFESDLVIYLDEVDSLVVPVTLTIPGEPSIFRELNGIYMVLEKNEEAKQQALLRNTGGTQVDFRFEHNIPVLTLTPLSGSLQVREEEVIEISAKGAPGIYEDNVLFHSSIAPEPDIIPVHITIYDSGAVFYAPAELALQVRAGEITTHSFLVRNDGINTVSFTTDVTMDSVFSLDPPKGTIEDKPLELTLTIDARKLSAGSYKSRIRFITNDSEHRSVYTILKLNVTPVAGAGNILREMWTGIPGKEVRVIPVDTPPSNTNLLPKFEAPLNAADNYGTRIRGYVQAPATGAYKFWIASDDQSELWLSTDESEGNKRRIAYITGFTNPGQWTKYTTQVSATINLVANRKYYIEALHKEGTGADHVAVGWQLPGGALERPIPGLRLIPYGQDVINDAPVVTIESPREGDIISAPANIDINASAVDEDGRVVKVEFFNGETRLGTDVTVPYGYQWKNVSEGNYQFVVKATDNLGAVDSASVNVMVTRDQPCAEAGRIVREQWNGIRGTSITSIPLDKEPSFREVLTLFESPSNIADNYGTRIRGFLCVPLTGEYTFWIASNDKSELWLSTDSGEANKKMIAHAPRSTDERQWRKFSSQRSAPIFLEAGKKYYVEALHKEGIGTDHVAVGWQMPDGSFERPIPGVRLLPFEKLGTPPTITILSPKNGESFTSPATVTISAEASDKDGVVKRVSFYNGAVKLGEDWNAPYSFTWTDVPGGTHSLTAVAIDDQGQAATSELVSINVETLCTASGTITREFWKGISGNYVSSIPVNSDPHGIESLTVFEGPVNVGTNYGARISGYICPPETGEYIFWISSNDHSELWLSTDRDEANKKKIAFITGATNFRQWDKFRTQKSVAITLTKGRSYYIEALHKQGIGTDHVSVGWQLPDGTLERPIKGSNLSPVTSESVAIAATSASVNEGETLRVDVYPNPVKGEKLTVEIGGGENGDGEIVIRQLTGLSVYSESIKCTEGCRTQIDIQKNLTPGVYILQVNKEGRIFTEKLVVP